MHNEAEAVNDDNWAQDTKQAARLFGWRGHLTGFLVALGCALSLSITFNLVYFLLDERGLLAPSPADQVYVYYISLTIILISIGILLGRCKLSPVGIGTAFSLMPIIDPIVNIFASFINLNGQRDLQISFSDFIASVQFASGAQIWIIPMMLLTAALTYAGAVLGQRSSRRARTA